MIELQNNRNLCGRKIQYLIPNRRGFSKFFLIWRLRGTFGQIVSLPWICFVVEDLLLDVNISLCILVLQLKY